MTSPSRCNVQWRHKPRLESPRWLAGELEGAGLAAGGYYCTNDIEEQLVPRLEPVEKEVSVLVAVFRSGT